LGLKEGKQVPEILWRKNRLIHLVLALVTVLFLPSIYFRLVNGRAYKQKSDKVVVREPGERFLGAPHPVAPEARKDLEFAWLSESAYQRIPEKEDGHTSCQDSASVLGNAGWSRWPDFPEASLQDKISRSHLRVEVWNSPSQAAVAVAFGGTVFNSGKDWKSNLRWFIPRHKEEYTDIVEEFGPAFVGEFVRRKQEPEWVFLDHATIFATGHSLGGG
jgi:hypothetical protein